MKKQDILESPRTKTDLLVQLLREGLRPLVIDGLIDESRANERANNMAMILLGSFEMEPID